MDKFERLAGPAAPMLRDNIDTDAIIPVSQMKMLSGDFGRGLFANLRYDGNGAEIPDFVLNRPEYRAAQILVVGNNFACGSSREHAVWALLGFGIRCVIAESFGDIFYNSGFRMGLLPIALPNDQLQAIGKAVTRSAGRDNTIVDLESQKVTAPDGVVYSFEVDATRRRILLEGLDAVGVTLLSAALIADFQTGDRRRRPWVYDIHLTNGTPALSLR